MSMEIHPAKALSSKVKSERNQYRPAFKYLFQIIKPYKKLYWTAAVASAVIIAANLVQTYATQELVDASVEGNLHRVLSVVIAFFLIIGTNTSLTWLVKMSAGKLSACSIRDLKSNTAGKLIHAEYGEVIHLRSGDILNTLNSDTAAVTDFLSGSLIDLLSQIAMALAAFFYLISIDPVICLVTFSYTPVGLIFTMTLNKKRNELYPVNADLKGEALSVVEQALSCIPVIKSFLMEKRIMKQISDAYGNVCKNDMKLSFYNALMQPACYTTSHFPRLIYLLYAGHLVISGNMTVGTLIALYSLLEYIIGPTVYLPFMLNGLNRSIASISRISRIDSLPQSDKKSIGEYQRNSVIEPSIEVSSLFFSYGNEKPILSDVSFRVIGNGITALQGASGSGKTTLLDLLCGLYRPVKGTVRICGMDPAKYDLSSIVSSVQQDSYLFHASIQENIGYGKPNISDAEIAAAAKKAGAHEFISSLKDGYQTIVGDGGDGLSGGQMQRIALAQAVLKNAPVWLLDEPTSALDEETESKIIDTLKVLSRDRLILISAHRDALLRAADCVITLENGGAPA